MADSASQFVGEIPENYDKRLGPHIFEGYAEDLTRRVAVIAPARVLELAAGTGILSRKLRNTLPADSRLIVTDLNAPMLELARRKFGSDENVEFLPADAMDLPFVDGEFDLIVNQFGVMFFPDKIASYREAARVLAPGGKYLFNAWGSMAENPFSEIAHNTAAKFFPGDPPGFYKVPFHYHDPKTVMGDLEVAGLTDIAHQTVDLEQDVKDWEFFARGLVFGNPLLEEIRDLGTVDPEDVMREVAAALRERLGPEPATMPLRATVYGAVKG